MKQNNKINYKMERTGKYGWTAVLLLAAGLLGACNESDSVEIATESLTVQEVFNSETTAVSRAVTTLTSGSIGVFRKTDSYYNSASNNVKYTYTSSKWVLDAATLEANKIKLGANDCRALLYAYYPNNGKIVVNADNVTVPLTSRMYDADYDLCYTKAGDATATSNGVVYNFRPGVTFPMKHAYTQLSVSITRGAGYTDTGNITQVKLALNGGGNYYSTGTQNISTGVHTPGTAVTTIDYTVPANTKVAKKDDNATLNYLLPPGKNGTINNLLLTLTVDGKTTQTQIAATSLAMEAGKRYVLKVLLNYNALAIGVNVTDDWDSQTAFNGEAEFVKP